MAAYKAAGVIPEKQPTDCSDCPVLEVTWFHAVEYCNILSRKAKFASCYTGSGKDFAFAGPNCRGFRLPTEAEWEYAARAGDPAVRYGEVDEIAWYDLNAGLVPHAVKGKSPMLGGFTTCSAMPASGSMIGKRISRWLPRAIRRALRPAKIASFAAAITNFPQPNRGLPFATRWDR